MSTRKKAASAGSSSQQKKAHQQEIAEEEKGVWLIEVFNVVYKGHKERKPENQIGTIKFNDGIRDHYLYNVNRIDQCKSSIQHLDVLELTGPRVTSISGKGPLTVDVDMFSGACQSSFSFFDCPSEDGLEVCRPTEQILPLKDDFGHIHIQYAIYDNATEAKIRVTVYHDHGNDENYYNEIYGVVAASTSKIGSIGYTSLLLAEKKSSDKIKLLYHRPLQLPLSRSIVALPLDSKLFLDINLSKNNSITSDEQELFKGIVSFTVERSGVHKKILKGKKCKIEVRVLWNGFMRK